MIGRITKINNKAIKTPVTLPATIFPNVISEKKPLTKVKILIKPEITKIVIIVTHATATA